MRSAFARFIDHFLSVRVRLRQNLLVALLRLGELFLDFFSVELALFDLPPTFLKNGKDWLVREALQKECNNAEANDLRQKQLQFQPNVSAVSRKMSVTPPLLAAIIRFIN